MYLILECFYLVFEELKNGGFSSKVMILLKDFILVLLAMYTFKFLKRDHKQKNKTIFWNSANSLDSI